MPGTIRRLSTYRFRETDRLLFDANVWLFLHSPQYGPNDSRVRVYSAAVKNIFAARSRIFIDALVLSEFINAWARFAYNTLPAAAKPRGQRGQPAAGPRCSFRSQTHGHKKRAQ